MAISQVLPYLHSRCHSNWLRKHIYLKSNREKGDNNWVFSSGGKILAMGACLRSKEIRWMDPKSIKFSEDSIAYFFQRGAPNTRWFTDSCVGLRRGDESLQSLLEKLSAGAIKVHDIPRIRVFKYKDCWYSPDNRRLWVFRQHGEEIQVDIVGRPANAYLAKLEQRHGDGESTFIIKDHERKQSHEFASKQDLLNQILKWSPRVLLSNLPFQEAWVWPQFFKMDSWLNFLRLWKFWDNFRKYEVFLAGKNCTSDLIW